MELAIKPKYVWWDLDCLHVPRDSDPYEFRWIIESALNKKFGAGPVTIFAVGNLNRIPLPVLELISHAGIVMKHTTQGGGEIYTDIIDWTRKLPAPAIIMLISDREYEYIYLGSVEARGHTIIRTYVNQKPDSPKYASDVWLWKCLLTQETPRPRQALQGKCCGTDWECLVCPLFRGKGFTDFTTHLKTRKHLLWEWFTVNPNASVYPTDEELDSLHLQLMTHVVKQSKPRPRRTPKPNPMMVKVRSVIHKDFESFMEAFRQAHDCQVGHQDCLVFPTRKELASFDSKQSKPHKLCEHKKNHL